jgi:hypothetical protein
VIAITGNGNHGAHMRFIIADVGPSPQEGDEHVVGLGPDGAVHEFFFTRAAGRWQHGNISESAGVKVAPGSGLTSWIVADNGDEHVVGLGPDGAVHEFFFTRAAGRWQHGNISQDTVLSALTPVVSIFVQRG